MGGCRVARGADEAFVCGFNAPLLAVGGAIGPGPDLPGTGGICACSATRPRSEMNVPLPRLRSLLGEAQRFLTEL